ncbi:hypothetical protein K3495_g8236 [Podosphaera aphanis]|nr:hypothetical protein K3495_g8236 [Podosphaera aphanis]
MGSPKIQTLYSYKLAAADRQISVLKSKVLPIEPHLLLVEDQTPHLRFDPYQYRGTPFEPYEVRHLQYLTMVCDENRGLAHPQGNWHDEIESCSPAAIAKHIEGPLSSTREAKAPSKKISIADYKRMKQDGNLKSNSTAKSGLRSSNTPSSEPMSRASSGENAQDSKRLKTGHITTDAKEILKSQIADLKAEARSAVLLSNPPYRNSNKIKKEDVPRCAKSTSDTPQKASLLSPIKTIKKNPPLPRPQSPRQNGGQNPHDMGPKQTKRPLESCSTIQQTQKRPKLKTATPPPSRPSSVPRKPDHSRELKASPAQSKITAKSTLPAPTLKKAAPTKPPDVKITSPKLTPIPPLLSPLPADLDDSPDVVSLPHPLDTPKADIPLSPIFVHPPLLSPNLPPIVEQELARLQRKNSALNSVEARHEKVRRPDTPGVARKTVSKVGHPPKKSTEPSKMDIATDDNLDDETKDVSESKSSFVVKIKYKKRRAKDIERILRMTSKIPSARFLELEADRLAAIRSKSNAVEERPLSKDEKSIPNSQTLSSTPKKRRSGNSEVYSPSVKRSKIHNIDASKLPAPLRSPAPIIRKNLSTPKKSDVKGISMRKIPSSDDAHANTPSMSTPASVEKRSITSSAGMSNAYNLYDANKFISEALSLKRKMDSELKTKDIDARKNLSDREMQVGLCTGIECLLAYYSAFSVKKEQRPIDRANSWESTLGLLEFVVRNAEPFLTLQTLALQVNALAREELSRSYIEHISIVKEASSDLLEKVARNLQSRDRYWSLSNNGQEALRGLGISDTVGPWTRWRSGREFILKVLERYEQKEKLGWKPLFD